MEPRLIKSVFQARCLRNKIGLLTDVSVHKIKGDGNGNIAIPILVSKTNLLVKAVLVPSHEENVQIQKMEEITKEKVS